MTHVKIPPAIIKFLKDADFLSLATSDDTGYPSAANKFLLKVEDDILYVIDFAKGKTWKNLRRNPHISFTVMDKDNLRDYQVNGMGEILEKGSEHERLMQELAEKQIRFATNRVIAGVKRLKTHESFTLPFSETSVVLKVKVEEIIEIGPAVELKKVPEGDGEGMAGSVISNRLLRELQYSLARHPQVTLFLGFWGVVFIGIIDYITGYEIGVSVFYLLPILAVTWGVGKRPGFLIVYASTIVWFIAEGMARGTVFPWAIILWNAIIRFLFFAIIVNLLSSLKMMFKKEEELATHDFLTGVFNPRYFFELTHRELKRLLRDPRPFTLVYLDVDDFKAVNDKAGHSAGDTLLCLIANAIKSSIREIDIVARLGGDEFAILMPLTGFDQSRIVIQRVRENFLKAVERGGRCVTFSMGAVTYFYPPATANEAIRLADYQMYVAKRKGKNTIQHVVFEQKDAPQQL